MLSSLQCTRFPRPAYAVRKVSGLVCLQSGWYIWKWLPLAVVPLQTGFFEYQRSHLWRTATLLLSHLWASLWSTKIPVLPVLLCNDNHGLWTVAGSGASEMALWISHSPVRPIQCDFPLFYTLFSRYPLVPYCPYHRHSDHWKILPLSIWTTDGYHFSWILVSLCLWTVYGPTVREESAFHTIQMAVSRTCCTIWLSVYMSTCWNTSAETLEQTAWGHFGTSTPGRIGPEGVTVFRSQARCHTVICFERT